MLRISDVFRRYDWVLAFSTFLLVCFGLVTIYGIALSQDQPDWSLLIKQLIALGGGLVLLVGGSALNPYWLRGGAKFIIGLGGVLAVSVLVFGSVIRGTRGWFRLGGWQFQPVEIIKVVVIIFLAWYFSRQRRPLNQLRYYLISGAGVAIFFFLTILQPDLGSALVLFFIWLGIALIIKPRWQHVLLGLAVGTVAILVAWAFIFAPYQKDRLRTFLDPAADPLGAGYNVTQSVIAVGSGGLVGSGLSFGSQSQLKFLPEAHTDFVFAVIAQEFGLVGVALLLGLFGVVLWRLGRIASYSRDDFSLFLVLGIMVLIFVQLLMNVAMNLGLAPVTGITLPFVSYGGSSLLVMMGLIGVAEGVQLRSK